MSLYRQFKTDPQVEKDGVILQYGLNSKKKPIGIRVARAGGANEAYTKMLERELKPYRRQIQTDTMDGELLTRILKKVTATTIVRGWENVEDSENNELPFTVENCMKLFEELPDLFVDVQNQSASIALYRAEIRETDAGN